MDLNETHARCTIGSRIQMLFESPRAPFRFTILCCIIISLIVSAIGCQRSARVTTISIDSTISTERTMRTKVDVKSSVSARGSVTWLEGKFDGKEFIFCAVPEPSYALSRTTLYGWAFFEFKQGGEWKHFVTVKSLNVGNPKMILDEKTCRLSVIEDSNSDIKNVEVLSIDLRASPAYICDTVFRIDNGK